MSSRSSVQTDLAAVAAPPGRSPDRSRNTAVIGLWIAVITISSVAVFWLTDRPWPPVAVALAGMVLAVWRMVKTQDRLQTTLTRAERARGSLENALREAQQMEALGRLAVGIAHDFNNQLTVISSNVEMLIRRLDDGQQPLLRHTDAAMHGVQRAAALTGRLLSLSRRPLAEAETVDVDRLISDLSNLLRRTLGSRTGLDVRLSDQPWFTWADVNQMEHALLSLALNARDQVPDGAVLTITVANVHLDDTANVTIPDMSQGDYIQISISGPVSSEHPACWYALDDMTGADMFMARACVREAGGYVLRSERSSFRIFLPRYMPSGVTPAVSSLKQGRRPTILVVEDDDAVRASCVEALRALEYQVLEAPDAMDAFRLIADRGGIDLLFTDLGLPGGVTGRALADAARNADPGIRVLFTTGSERADLPARAAAALLRKPFSAQQLAERVQQALTTEQPPVRSETVQW